MGGRNGGRFGWRGVIEDHFRLDIRQLRDHIVVGEEGTITWSVHGETLHEAFYAVLPDSLAIRHAVQVPGQDRGNVTCSISLERVPCRYGGHRGYWRCPSCDRRCDVVVLASHGHNWGCRRCLDLRYVSQGLVPCQRDLRRAERIYERLGGIDEYGSVTKPQWMRWSTFQRLLHQATIRATTRFYG